MIARYAPLVRHPGAFYALTGLTVPAFDALADEMLPRLAAALRRRRQRPGRQRAPGGGHPFTLERRDQLLLTVVWLRRYPTYDVLGLFFGVAKAIVCRTIAAVLPELEAVGRDTMRMPDPGRWRRHSLDGLLAATPELAVILDSFEQPVQRPKDRAEADRWYSGKKRRHTIKTQVAVDAATGRFVDVCGGAVGPLADLTLLEASGLLGRLPPGVGALGDLAYVGMGRLHPEGRTATPRRKPRGQPRPAADIEFNRAFARRRVLVEHRIGRLRTYQALSQADRHHRRHHEPRVIAVAGLLNRQLPIEQAA
jgi:DDE superfamily endonuclease/Helix-turn-helix of DDE superfamily endonuclease